MTPTMPVHTIFSNRTAIFVATSVGLLSLVSIFIYQVYAQPVARSFNTNTVVSISPGKAYLSGQAVVQASSTITTTRPPMLEIHIANNGLVLLRGARVMSISGSTVHVEMTWGVSHFTWIVQTSSNTHILTPQGESTTLADIHIGDSVTVTGMLSAHTTESTIDAEFVRG